MEVRYCLTGTLARAGHGVTIAVELARTSDSAVVWAERFSAGGNEFAELRREILTAVVANLEVRIVQHEIDAARRRPQAGLDAWASYHLGLDHMFRFNKADNAKAAALFEQALLLDPHFSRAFSGLSFTAFQDRFLHYSGDDDATARRARELAEEALRCDPLDPFAHLNLGRALWFDDAVPESIERLGASIALSPNYAQAIYSKSWAEMTLCDADSCDSNAAAALRLSPLDPLRYAMLGVRSMGALLRDDAETAADWGEKAARSPGAHKHIAIIAALGAGAAGRTDRAALWVKRARELDPHVSGAGFLVSFPFVESDGRERIERGLRDLRL